MTTKPENADTADKPGESIGFLRASEKMWIATFEIPLVFLEDLGFSKERLQAAKDLNRKFISGFYAQVYKVGDKLSFGGQSSGKAVDEPPAAEQPGALKATSAAREAAAPKATPAKPAAKARKAPATKAAPSDITE